MSDGGKFPKVSLASQIAAVEQCATHPQGVMKAIKGSANGAQLMASHLEAAASSLRWLQDNEAVIRAALARRA